jgi:hypothetical protein
LLAKFLAKIFLKIITPVPDMLGLFGLKETLGLQFFCGEKGFEMEIGLESFFMGRRHCSSTQGDQISLRKNRPKCSPRLFFWSKLIQSLSRGKE